MSLIGRFEHLPKRPKSDDARPLLEKIASQVKPIMSKRDWKVGTLAEFLPSDPSLLGNNMNRGERINLRLRPPGDPNGFYEYDQLVLVMLHELTHNEFGPHDAKFYKLLGELEEEFYDLKRKGFSGDGFHSSGNNLSGIKRDEYAGRLTGLQAAEKRLAAQRKIGKGGVLGGKSMAGKTIREVLADAAERRIRDDKTCSAEGSREVELEVQKAAEESVGVDAVDLTGSSDDERDAKTGTGPEAVKEEVIPDLEPNITKTVVNDASGSKIPLKPIRPTGKSSISSSSKLAQPSNRSTPSSRISVSPQPAKASSKALPPPAESPRLPRLETTEWSCPVCTLNNPVHHLSCDACATERPSQSIPTSLQNTYRSDGDGQGVYGIPGKGSGIGVKEGWFCGVCGEGPGSWDMWSCQGCGVVRTFG